MEGFMLSQLLEQIPVDELGRMVSEIQNPQAQAKQPLLTQRRVGFGGPLAKQQQEMQNKYYGGTVGGSRAPV